MDKKRGVFIVLEGIDNSGKTTQTELLAKALDPEQLRVAPMAFPSRHGAIGELLNSYLKGELALEAHAAHLLFSADRWQLSNEITMLLNMGMHVVADRYAYSGMAYSAAKGLDREWTRRPDHQLVKPDLVILLQVDPKEASKRGEYGSEVYERVEFQEIVAKELLACAEFYGCRVVNATQSMEAVHQQIMEHVNQTVEACATTPLQYIEQWRATDERT